MVWVTSVLCATSEAGAWQARLTSQNRRGMRSVVSVDFLLRTALDSDAERAWSELSCLGTHLSLPLLPEKGESKWGGHVWCKSLFERSWTTGVSLNPDSSLSRDNCRVCIFKFMKSAGLIFTAWDHIQETVGSSLYFAGEAGERWSAILKKRRPNLAFPMSCYEVSLLLRNFRESAWESCDLDRKRHCIYLNELGLCLGWYWYTRLFPFTEKVWRALSKSIPMPDPPFGPMEEKTILAMTARQHKAEVGKRAHDVNCCDPVMLEKSGTTGSTVVL